MPPSSDIILFASLVFLGFAETLCIDVSYSGFLARELGLGR